MSSSNDRAETSGWSRRDFLRVGTASASAASLTWAQDSAAAPQATSDVNLILLLLVGGPSQLETWDPKPSAPTQVRGPFQPIATNVTGIQVSEHFPRMAQVADRFAIIRSLHHQAAPIHETGQQLMQTGRLFRYGEEFPHYGAVLSYVRGPSRRGLPPFVLLPGPLGSTGVNISHGQGAGALGVAHAAATPTQLSPAAMPEDLRIALDRRRVDAAESSRYGRHEFGRSCLQARRLVEAGVRCVTVNMFNTVFDRITWDCHAEGGSLPTTLDDYRKTVCPMFDQAYTALLNDLAQRGLLASTLVVAMGEFGRTPQLNLRGGRDHWPGVWSILLAGGGVRGGQVIGSSDRCGAEPRERPVTPPQLAATIYHALGVDPRMSLPGPEGQRLPLVEANPLVELF